jgi:putative aminopeptidase FrvX
MPLPKVLKDLLALPTAPFAERAVMDHLERACRSLAGVKVAYDRHGNLMAHYRHAPRTKVPLAFVAHTDHPGFIALEMVDRRTVRAAFRGGVKPEYFPGTRVRFWTGNRWIRARVLQLSKATRVKDVVGWMWKPEEALLRVTRPVAPQSPGMWDLPEPALKGDLVTARGCDDIAGSAAMLTLLQRLSRKRARAEVYCLFTRAEEVGFVGAIAAARARTIPRHVPVLSIETSSVLPNAPQGAGPILRVGDRAAVFSPGLTAFCERVARSLAERRKSFIYQRKLMDGGICEAVPFIVYGHAASGICLALGNYHNMDKRREKIASESISLSDWRGMVDLFEALVVDEGDRGLDWQPMRQRLDTRFTQWAPLLGG